METTIYWGYIWDYIGNYTGELGFRVEGLGSLCWNMANSSSQSGGTMWDM